MAQNVADRYRRGKIQALAADGNQVKDANVAINPVFGIVPIEEGEGRYVIQKDEQIKDEYEDFVLRETGIAKEIIHNNRLLTGLGDPKKFLLDKNKAIEAAGRKIASAYEGYYVNLVNRGYSFEEAKARSIKYAQELKEIELKQIEIDYPSSIINEAANRLHKKAQVNF